MQIRSENSRTIIFLCHRQFTYVLSSGWSADWRSLKTDGLKFKLKSIQAKQSHYLARDDFDASFKKLPKFAALASEVCPEFVYGDTKPLKSGRSRPERFGERTVGLDRVQLSLTKFVHRFI